MPFCKTLRELIMKLDFFPTTQLLCYRGENYYSTLTGGLLSLVIIIAFIYFLSIEGLRVFRKEEVKFTADYQEKITAG